MRTMLISIQKSTVARCFGQTLVNIDLPLRIVVKTCDSHIILLFSYFHVAPSRSDSTDSDGMLLHLYSYSVFLVDDSATGARLFRNFLP